MDLTTLFSQINSAYRGTDDDAPTEGTDDFTLWLLTTNRKISEWARDTKNVWQSNFNYDKPNEPGTVNTSASVNLIGTDTNFSDYAIGDTILVAGETVRTIATVASDTALTVTTAFSTIATGQTFTHASIIANGVQSYSLHRRFLNPSDEAFVVTSTQSLCYDIGKAPERSRYYNEVYIAGNHPQVLGFYGTNQPPTAAIGGTLKVPGYYSPADLADVSDVIPVDDPYWLVYAVASELAFNDLTYEDKYNDLNVKANNLYAQMSSNNRRGTNDNPRVAQTNVQRIRGNSSWRDY